MNAVRVTLALVLLSAPAFAAEAPPSATYDVDPVHSFVLFEVRHLGVSDAWGRFDDKSGTIVLDEADPSRSSVALDVVASSVDTGNERRDKDLRGPDFFNATQFPAISFKSTEVRRRDDGVFLVRGNLTLHGVTKPLTLEVSKTGEGDDPWGGNRVGFRTEFTVRRSEFGMTFLPDVAGDEVRLVVAVEAKRR